VGTDEISIGRFKGEGELELWLTVSGEELDREGDVNTGGVWVELSDECTPLG
jgi:hypothetical protein